MPVLRRRRERSAPPVATAQPTEVRSPLHAQVARGRTRTTCEVARAVGIALPSVGHQLAVLRDGGLVASHREGQFVSAVADRVHR